MKKISYQINRLIILTLLFMIAIFYFSFTHMQGKMVDGQLEQIRFLLKTVASGEKRLFIDEIFDKRVEALKIHRSALLKIHGVMNVDAFSDKQLSFFNPGQQLGMPGGAAFNDDDVYYVQQDDFITLYYRLAAAGEIVGYLQIDYSLSDIEKNKKGMSLFFWAFLIALILSLLSVLYISLYQVVIRPVKKLTFMIQRIFNTGDYTAADFTMLPERDKEISSYFAAHPDLNEMEMLETSFLHLLRKQKDFTDNLQQMVEEKTTELLSVMKDISDLKEMLPICSHCKKIRDDQGYWHQVEQYISSHSAVDFSHSLCPDCLTILYPQYVAKRKEKKKE